MVNKIEWLIKFNNKIKHTMPRSFTPSNIFPETAPDILKTLIVIVSLGSILPLSIKYCNLSKFRCLNFMPFLQR